MNAIPQAKLPSKSPALLGLKNTEVELELLTDFDMIMMVEKGNRGGKCHAIHRYAKGSNEFMKNNRNAVDEDSGDDDEDEVEDKSSSDDDQPQPQPQPGNRPPRKKY